MGGAGDDAFPAVSPSPQDYMIHSRLMADFVPCIVIPVDDTSPTVPIVMANMMIPF